MRTSSSHSPIILRDHSKISIIGGGPSGVFFAVHLQREAQKAGKQFDITIIEKNLSTKSPADGTTCHLEGCNYCSGVISPDLYDALVECDLGLPPDIVAQEFSHVWIQGHWKNFPLKAGPGRSLRAVFRGALPPNRENPSLGMDSFLLAKAVQRGIKVIGGTVVDIRLSDTLTPCLTLKSLTNGSEEIESDLVGICCGVKALLESNDKENTLLAGLKRIDPTFQPPRVRPALIFEICLERDYIRKYLNKDLYFIVSGSNELRLEHIALVPKKEYISVALVGKSIDKAALPEDNLKIINALLGLAHIKAILPGLNPENIKIACSCNPMIAVSQCRPLSAHRIAPAGDVLGAMIYREGLHSAFDSARVMAETVVWKGVDSHNLREAARIITRRIRKENRYCKLIFSIMQIILKSGLSSRILYQSFATEMKSKPAESWPLGSVLWKVVGGSAEYKAIFKELVSLPVLTSLMVGIYKTFRNLMTEFFFGLKWGDYGRYPTVIAKDKRRALKISIQEPLGVTLPETPEMERMYAIKIRASSKAIFEELAKFGGHRAKFLKLRFIDVQRTRGSPNKVGAVVTYRLKMSSIAMNLHLVQAIEEKTLLYEPEELFTRRGVLLFDITPTRDGNHRLSVYTAFDYRKGKSLPGRVFFNFLRHFFPDFAHDVVWNHALCTIKAEAEEAEKSGFVGDL